jgi:hypothetical protein
MAGTENSLEVMVETLKDHGRLIEIAGTIPWQDFEIRWRSWQYHRKTMAGPENSLEVLWQRPRNRWEYSMVGTLECPWHGLGNRWMKLRSPWQSSATP